jgi:hypothetical protein
MRQTDHAERPVKGATFNVFVTWVLVRLLTGWLATSVMKAGCP